MTLTSKPPFHPECGGHHYFSDPCPGACSSTGSEHGPSKPEVEGSTPSAPSTEPGAVISVEPPPAEAPVLAEPENSEPKRPMTGVERQMRWRVKNRERYNSYMAEYRKRKRDG